MATVLSIKFHHFYPLLFCVLSIITSNAQTDNGRINFGSSLVASDDSESAWRSPSGEFAIGFRSTGNQDHFLLAIWFDKIPGKTIVWYANGDNLAPKRSRIELTSNGNLVLYNPEGKELWKALPVGDKVAYAALTDRGNFVLANGNSSFLWESFKYPCDTILPTQVLEVNAVLSSKLSSSNFSKGRFQLRFLPDGNLVLNIIALPTNYAYEAYYRSGTSDDRNRMNSGYRVSFNETGQIFVLRRNGNVTSLTSGSSVTNKDFYLRATLDFDGLFTLYSHPKAPRNGTWAQSWSSIWYEPKDICTDASGEMGSGACGYNAICTLDFYGRPSCECIPGFSFSDPDYKYSDCKQDKVQKCHAGGLKPEELYEMNEAPNTYFPKSSNYEWFPLSSEDDCSSSCLNDCNCVVAVVRDGTCRKKRLPLTSGPVDRQIYAKTVVKVPRVDGSSEVPRSRDSDNGKRDQTALNLVLSVLLGSSVFVNFLFVLVIALIAYFTYQKKLNVPSDFSISGVNIRSFTYKELREATKGFKEELGRGAFGIVYKGVISSPSSKNVVAVKRLDNLTQDGEKEFTTEASTIAKTHHKNLVRLLGFCQEGPHRLLVYDFMSNGTLASFLFGIIKPDWNKRIQMASGIARGLMYLHEECSTQIIHCDIKPQNILLDDSYTARISDFGLAKLLMSEQSRTQTVIRGTKGYVAPEWFRSMPITAKVDVYSYGVMLFEIICCRRNVETESKEGPEVILTDWAYDCYKGEKLDKLVENDEEARNDMKRLERLVMVAIWCIQEDPTLRPFIRNVVQMLEGVVEVPNPPCPSPFSSIY